MSQHWFDAEFPQPLPTVAAAYRQAIAGFGWQILEDRKSGVVCKEPTKPITSFTFAAKIDISWQQVDERTKVKLDGSIMGWGPLQLGHLKGEMGRLQTSVKLILQQSAIATPPSGLAVDLQRLGEMKDKGLLSNEEFSQAKAKLIGGPPTVSVADRVKIVCSHCGRSLRAKPAAIGREVVCLECKRPFVARLQD